MSTLECIWDAKAQLGEGVIWHTQEQALYWVDIIQSSLHRLAADGSRQSWHFPGRASAVTPCEGGGLLATFEDGLSHIDLDTATVTLLLPLETDLPDNRFNDGCADTRGQFWFGSMDDKQEAQSGGFYCLNRSGEVARLESFGAMCITNGPTFSADNNWIFFTDTLEKKIFRARLDSAGNPEDPELHIDFSSLAGHPDGMCTDTEGGLWVCHFGGACVTRFNADGEVDQLIDLPVPNITKCAFGGENLQTLYITTAATGLGEDQLQQFPLSGGLFAIDLPFRGLEAVNVTPPVKTTFR